MNIQELKIELEKKLTAIELKIEQIQNEIDESDAPSVELEDILLRLKTLQEKLVLQHDQLAAMETEGEKFDELEKKYMDKSGNF